MSPASTTPDLTRLFDTMGLKSTEMRAYVYLLEASPATPTAVAQATGQSRGRIYETMKLLVQRGLAKEQATNPVQYVPVPLAEVLSLATQENLTRQGFLADLYTAVAGPSPGLSTTDLVVLSGRAAAQAQARTMTASSIRSLFLAGAGRFPERLLAAQPLLEELRRAADRGIQVEIWLPDPSTPTAEALRGRLGQVDLHTIPPDARTPWVTVGNDATLLLQLPQPDDEAPEQGRDVSLLVRSPPIAQMGARSLRNLLQPSASNETGMASATPALLPKAGEEEFFQVLAEVRREVVAMGPRGWSRLLRENWQSSLGAYAGAKRRGIRFRALLPEDPEEHARAEPFSTVWDFRTGPWVPLWLFVIDGTHLFLGYSRQGEGGPVLRHSTDPDEVRFYVDLFERLWSQAHALASPTRPSLSDG